MLEVLDVVDTGRRRRFSVAEKVRIVEESLCGPRLARSTARRYGIALSGLYQWRRQYQRGELGGSGSTFRAVGFLPEVAAETVLGEPSSVNRSQIEIVLANGRKLVSSEAIAPEVLARLIAVLERA